MSDILFSIKLRSKSSKVFFELSFIDKVYQTFSFDYLSLPLSLPLVIKCPEVPNEILQRSKVANHESRSFSFVEHQIAKECSFKNRLNWLLRNWFNRTLKSDN